jgi:hypothetical protein
VPVRFRTSKSGDGHVLNTLVPPRPTVYVDLFQRPQPAITVNCVGRRRHADDYFVCTRILHEFDPEIAPRFRTLSGIYSVSLGSRRFRATRTPITWVRRLTE